MPSASPESRRRRRHRSRSRSKHRSHSGSPSRKRANDRHSRTKQGSRETSPASRKPSQTKSRPRSEERSTHKNASRPNQESRWEDREPRPVRTQEASRERGRDKPRSNQHNASPPRRRNPADGVHERRPRFDRMRIKQEPVSEDEGRRRQRHDRVAFKNEFGSGSAPQDGAPPEPPKDKPNFGLSGKLAEDTNVYNGVVIKYSEPVEARKPKKKWRLYAFKGSEALPMLPIHRQSAYLLGRERRVADIPIDHPSCSKQHAVFQYRAVPYKRDDGRPGRRIRPYIIDLESANGTFVNNNKIEARRYVELMEKDVIKFGFSSREYVLLHEGSSADDEQDEVLEEDGAEQETAEEEAAEQS